MEGDDHPKTRALRLLEAVDTAEAERLGEAVAHAVAELSAEEATLRRAALEAVGRLANLRAVRFDQRVAHKVAAMKSDPDVQVRAEVAVALALVASPDARSEMERLALHVLLEDESPLVRREAAAALGDVGDESARDKLACHLEDADLETRFEAAFALATLRDPRGVDVLANALESAPRRLDACEAFRRLGDSRALPPLNRVAGRLFLGWPDRLTILATMAWLGDPAAGYKVIDRTRSRNREERAYALSLLGSHRISAGAGVLEAVARDPKDKLRDTAIRALGELGRTEAAPLLAEIVRETRAPDEVRTDAAAALASLGSGLPADLLTRLEADRDARVRLLTERGREEHARRAAASGGRIEPGSAPLESDQQGGRA